jgi:hypothetical protein
MSRPGLRRRYRGFAAGVDVGDGGARSFRQNAAGDIQADEWRVLDHARRARSQLHCRIGRSAVSAGDEFGRNRIA